MNWCCQRSSLKLIEHLSQLLFIGNFEVTQINNHFTYSVNYWKLPGFEAVEIFSINDLLWSNHDETLQIEWTKNKIDNNWQQYQIE